MDDMPILRLLRFKEFLALPEERQSLAEGALQIADMAYPTLDHREADRQLDLLADSVRTELGMGDGDLLPQDGLGQRSTALHVLAALRDVLGGREGFHGNRDEYYDPRNSFLNDVLTRRTGLPITLSIVFVEVAGRIGAPLVGVGLPSHFMAKWALPIEEGDDLFVDAFAGGEVLDMGACRRFVLRIAASGASGGQIFDPQWFEAVGTRAILTRILHNLKHVYLQRGETAYALEVVERLMLLVPDAPEEQRDRGLLRLAAGEPLLAAADIAAYAARVPDAPELARLQRRLATINEIRAKPN
jgi:regulator of sirC expression with transglutaminase-like and TPR domain